LYRDGIAFIDQFFVMPEYRKLGIGRQLFEAIFDENLRKDYNVGLHSEVAISDYYNKKHGFSHFNDVFIDVIRITNILERSSRNKNFRTTTNAIEALDDVCKFDARIWKKSRKVFLSEWIQRKDARFLAVYINGEMFGYGVIRHATSKSGYLFGPIYAINDEAFLTLFDGLVESVENDAVIELRSPSINSARLHQLLDNRATLNNYSKYITQYTKSVPECNYEPVYAITDTSIPV
uniref:N-acetyltransferase domain-containing protein n=1 Tax=Toxocara canis TaxID=6265 RepID=A0A183VFD2_TOXCA